MFSTLNFTKFDRISFKFKKKKRYFKKGKGKVDEDRNGVEINKFYKNIFNEINTSLNQKKTLN